MLPRDASDCKRVESCVTLRVVVFGGMTTAPLDDKLIARLKVLLEGCTRTELAARCGLSLSTFMKALGGLPIGATTRRLIALQVGK